MKKIYFILPIVVVFFMVLCMSCEKTIKYKGEVSKPMLYVNAVLDVELDTQFVFVGQTKFFLDTCDNSKCLSDADCRIQYKDGEYQRLTFDKKEEKFRYVIPDSVCVGDTFRLMVTHPDFDTLRATAVVPNMLEIYVDTINYKTIDMGVNLIDSKQISIYLDSQLRGEGESVGVEMGFLSYLSWEHEEYDDWDNPTGNMVIDTLDNAAYWCEEPIIADNSFEQYFSLSGEFSDKYKYRYTRMMFTTDDFSSWPYKIDVLLPNNKTAFEDPNDELIGGWIFVGIYGNDYYKYLRTKYESEKSSNMFSEPIQLYSTVTGGVGFFGVKKDFRVDFWLKR